MTPDQLLVSVRRRLRRARATTMAGWWGWIPALIGVVVIFAARHVNWVLLEPLGLFIMVAGVMGLAAWGWSRRFSDLQVARTADAGLGTKDALSAHVEFRADGPYDRADPEWMRLIERRAVVAAASGDAKGASPRWRFSRLRLMGLALFSVLAAALMIAANPQDRVRAHERAARQVQEHAMAEIDRASEELDRGSDAHKAMAELVEKLRTADPAQALELMREAQAQLLDSAGKGLESARAAAEGLDASLRTDPLPGTDGGTASEQLDTLAGNLGTLDDEQRELLVERLKALAATQVAGSPDVAAALGDAADAVASGSQGASDALTRAAGAQRRMSAAVAQRSASAAAAQTVGEAARAMADALSPSSGMPGSQVASGTAGSAVQPGGRNPGGGMPGNGQGQGNQPGGGQGQGNQPGNGQGQGNQPGGGQGQGGSPGGGGGGLRSGSGAARGGPATIGNGTGTGSDPGRRAEGAEESDGRVFAPDPSARLGANGPASAEGGDLSNSAGKDDTASRVGSARVPLSEAVRRYSGGATRAAAQPGLPPAHRALISDYFARLSAGS